MNKTEEIIEIAVSLVFTLFSCAVFIGAFASGNLIFVVVTEAIAFGNSLITASKMYSFFKG